MIQKEFDKYMDEFKQLPLKEKQSITLEQLKMLASLVEEMCKVDNVESELLLNRELVDTNSSDYTQDDFVEAVVVYVNSIQNLICDYNLKK